MKIHLSNIIEIEEPTKDVLDFVKKSYIYSNPNYIKKQRMGFSTYKTARNISK